MKLFRLRVSSYMSKMAEELGSSAAAATTTSSWAKSRSLWPSVLHWIPTFTDHIIASEKRLLSIVKTPYVQEQVNIGSGPSGSNVRWFRSVSNERWFINTVTFDSKGDSPTLVMVHGYAASQGFFFRNFDALASRLKVIAVDQLGASVWKVPTTFIYGYQDWMNYQGAQEARKHMKVPSEIIRVLQAGHLVFIDNPSGFDSAMFYACLRFLSPNPDNESLPQGLAFV